MPGAARRFYEQAGVGSAGDGFSVTLDGRAVRTPGGRPLGVPTRALAEAIAAEWAAQELKILPHTMPITRLACTAVDRVGEGRQTVIEHTAGYGGTDLLCYRADGPEDLVRRQQAAWQPLLDWAAETHGARLQVTSGVLPVEQPAAALAALLAAVEALDDLELTALAAATQACGSVLVALALAAGRIDAEEAVTASQLDERYQSETWGENADAQKRSRALADDIFAAARFLALYRDTA